MAATVAHICMHISSSSSGYMSISLPAPNFVYHIYIHMVPILTIPMRMLDSSSDCSHAYACFGLDCLSIYMAQVSSCLYVYDSNYVYIYNLTFAHA